MRKIIIHGTSILWACVLIQQIHLSPSMQLLLCSSDVVIRMFSHTALAPLAPSSLAAFAALALPIHPNMGQLLSDCVCVFSISGPPDKQQHEQYHPPL